MTPTPRQTATMRKAPYSLDLEDFRSELIARIEHLAALEQPGPVDMGNSIDNECDQDTLFRELRILRHALAELEGDADAVYVKHGTTYDHQPATPPPTPAGTATPGPWQVDECADAHGDYTVRLLDGTPHGVTDAEPVATVYTAADAALIAAAPELRDALACILSRVSKHSAGYCVVDAADINEARTLLARLGVTL